MKRQRYEEDGAIEQRPPAEGSRGPMGFFGQAVASESVTSIVSGTQIARTEVLVRYAGTDQRDNTPKQGVTLGLQEVRGDASCFCHFGSG